MKLFKIPARLPGWLQHVPRWSKFLADPSPQGHFTQALFYTLCDHSVFQPSAEVTTPEKAVGFRRRFRLTGGLELVIRAWKRTLGFIIPGFRADRRF